MARRAQRSLSENLSEHLSEQVAEPLAAPVEEMRQTAREVKDRYSGGEDRPLGSYLALIATYLGACVVAAVVVRRRRVALPERPSWSDLALVSLATFRGSRLLAKDSISSPLRAPFTRYRGVSGPAELAEEVVGTGPRHALGELVTCPFCMSQWLATVFTVGLLVAPRPTRVVASVLAAVGVADVLHLAYQHLER